MKIVGMNTPLTYKFQGQSALSSFSAKDSAHVTRFEVSMICRPSSDDLERSRLHTPLVIVQEDSKPSENADCVSRCNAGILNFF